MFKNPERQEKIACDLMKGWNTSVPENKQVFRSRVPEDLLLFTRSLPRDGDMADNHGAPETEQLPRVWTRGRKETDSRQRVSGAESVAGQCRMK